MTWQLDWSPICSLKYGDKVKVSGNDGRLRVAGGRMMSAMAAIFFGSRLSCASPSARENTRSRAAVSDPGRLISHRSALWAIDLADVTYLHTQTSNWNRDSP